MPKLNHSMCISLIEDFDESQKEGQSFVFILPRGDDKLWLGGMVQPYQWDRNLTLDYPPIRRMFENVKEFYPPLRNYGDKDVEEVLVGLRPARKGNVRLEWDPMCPSLLHNYGHGGSGVTFSWGCAIEASSMVDRVLKRPQLYLSKLWTFVRFRLSLELWAPNLPFISVKFQCVKRRSTFILMNAIWISFFCTWVVIRP